MDVIYRPAGKAGEYCGYAVNLYKGCGHKCGYCYVPGVLRTTRSAWHGQTPSLRRGVLDGLKKDAIKLAALNPGAEVLLCFTSDPYHPGDTSATREAIEIIGMAGLVPVVLTKGGSMAVRDLDLLQSYGGKFGQSPVWSQDANRLKWEPSASRVAEREAAGKAAHDLGVFTWVSLEPVIDDEEALCVIEQNWLWVDHWKVGMVNHDGELARRVDWGRFSFRVRALLEMRAYTEVTDCGGGMEKGTFYLKQNLRAQCETS